MAKRSEKTVFRFDEDQQAVLDWREGEAVVAAAAGSGKTLTLIEWVARRVEEGADPSRIAIFAYNRVAGQKLARDIVKRIGKEKGKEVTAGTLHGRCWSFFREAHPGDTRTRSSAVLGLSNCPVTVYQILPPLLREAGLADLDVKDVLEISERLRESCLDVGAPEREVEQKEASELIATAQKYVGHRALDYLRAAQLYEEAKRKHAVIDFTDMMGFVWNALRLRRGWALRLRGRYDYVALDEAQDANLIQARLVMHLMLGAKASLWIGDFRQNCYSFRGARPDLIRKRLEAGVKLLPLRYNYRSDSRIIEHANRFAGHFPWHIGGDSRPRPGAPSDVNAVEVVELYDRTFVVAEERGEITSPPEEYNPADAIAERVRVYSEEPSKFAVLCRTNAELVPFEATLVVSGVAYTSTASGGSVWKLKDAKDFLGYLRAAEGKAALRELCSIANRPVRLLSKAKLGELFGDLAEHEIPPNAVERLAHASHYPSRLFGGVLGRLGVKRWSYRCEAAAEHLREDLRNRQTAELDPDADRVRLVEALCKVAKRLDGLEALEVIVKKSLSKGRKRKSAVTLSTIHKAKGAEWPVVYVCASGLPCKRAETPAEQDEEARLYYVAITRARDKVVIVGGRDHEFTRLHWGEGEKTK